MSEIYSKLAAVYEIMYPSFINYDEEFDFYHQILKRQNVKSVIELGCGTGNLANSFQQNGYHYIGLDFSEDMLNIARKKNPFAQFMIGDMRNFSIATPIESALITARSLSYLTRNEDILACFSSIKKNLRKGGIISFDIIDANRFILPLANGKHIRHEAMHNGIRYIRETDWSLNVEESWNFNWHAEFFQENPGAQPVFIGSYDETVRSFTENDITLALEVCGFDILDITDRPTYAFPTLVFVARSK